MQVDLVATSGGPHPAETLAGYTIRDIISIAPTASDEDRRVGTTLAGNIYPVLINAHRQVQQNERNNSEMGPPIPDAAIVDSLVVQVQNIAVGSKFEDHFKRGEVIDNLKRVLFHHFATNIDIERKWKADKMKGIV